MAKASTDPAERRRQQRRDRLARRAERPPVIAPHFLDRYGTGAAFAVSEGVVLQWERAGLLTPIKLPGLRAVRYAREDVAELARRIRAGEIA